VGHEHGRAPRGVGDRLLAVARATLRTRGHRRPDSPGGLMAPTPLRGAAARSPCRGRPRPPAGVTAPPHPSRPEGGASPPGGAC
jgi:hypothetical protein